MSLVFNCPKCRKEYEVDDKLAGRKSRCGVCATTFRIPSPTPDHAPQSAKASADSWDEPVPFFEVVDDEPVRSFKAARVEEPVYYDDDPPPPPRARPVDFAKQREPKTSSSFALDWETAVKVVLGVGLLGCLAVAGVSFSGLAHTPLGMLGKMIAIGCMSGGGIAILVGAVGQLIETVREGFLYLLGCIFVPFFALYYLITRWETMKGPWGLTVSGYLVVIGMGFLLRGLNAPRVDGPAVVIGGGPAARHLGVLPRGVEIRPMVTAEAAGVWTVELRGLPSDREPGTGPTGSDVANAIRERLKSLFPNCQSVMFPPTNGMARITLLSSASADELTSSIDFGETSRGKNPREIIVMVSRAFIDAVPVQNPRSEPGGAVARSRPEPRSRPRAGDDPAESAFPGDDPVSKSLAEITGGESHRRKQAVERLSRIPPNDRLPEVVRALVPLLIDDDGFLASEVCKALAIWKSPEGVEPLIQSTKDTRFFVRHEAIRALGTIGDERAVEPILACWGQDGREVENALKALGPVAEKGVLARIAVGDADTRRKVCEILADIGGVETLKAMRRMTPDPDLGVQQASRVAWRAIVARVGPPPPLKKK